MSRLNETVRDFETLWNTENVDLMKTTVNRRELETLPNIENVDLMKTTVNRRELETLLNIENVGWMWTTVNRRELETLLNIENVGWMWLHMVYTVTDNFISRRISVQDLRGRYGIEGNMHFHIEAQVISLYILLKYFIFTIFPSPYVLNF